jgi:ATP phosphoribosyltransferase
MDGPQHASNQVQVGQTFRVNGRPFIVEKVCEKEALLIAPKTRKHPEQRIARRLTTLEQMHTAKAA